MQQMRACLRGITMAFGAAFSPCARLMARHSAANLIAGIKLAALSNSYQDVGEICGLYRRLVRVLMSLMTLSTVAVVSKMISAVRRETMTI
jgi:hypothetical protein